MCQDFPSIVITNALLRVDGVSGTLPFPFELPSQTLDSWVLELPSPVPDVEDWCAQTTEALSRHTGLFQRAQNDGGKLTLFVEFASVVPVLRLGAGFLRLLAGLGISLECAFDAHPEGVATAPRLIAEFSQCVKD